MEEFKIYQSSGYLTKLVTDASDVRKTYEEISGSLVEFDTPISAPLAELLVDINPVQDLHGQDAPYPAGGGGNLCPPLVGTSEYTGLSVTTNADGSLTVSGTATGSGYITEYANLPKTIVAGTTFIVSVKTALPVTLRAFFDNGVSDVVAGNTSGGSTTLNVDTTKIRLYLFIQANTSYNFTIYFQLEEGSTVTPWKPYSNICPITGWTGCEVWVKDEYDTSLPATASVTFPDGQTVYGGSHEFVSGDGVSKVAKENITSFDGAFGAVPNGYAVYWYNSLYTHIVPESDFGLMKCNVLKYTSLGRQLAPSLSYGCNDGSNSTYVFILPSTITSLSEANAWLADNPIEATFYLATPTEIQLTPQEISTLAGVNNIWADTGDVSVKYRTH